MGVLREGDRPAIGLRERKKAKTRASIQEHALRLFHEQGYDETTVEQIADAAEISPSTFFRYFPAKEDVVMYDAFDPLLYEAFRAQPPNHNTIQAMRGAIREVFADLPAETLAPMRERGVLMFSVPVLRAAMMNQIVQTVQPFTELIAERTGRSPDDLEVRVAVGALTGAMLAAILPTIEAPATQATNLFELMDKSLALLETGLPL